MVFPVVMYGCESWIIKEAKHWRTGSFELWCWSILESLLDRKEINPVNPRGNQSWIFIGGTDPESETLILRPPDAKNWLIRKDPDGWERLKAGGEGTTEDEMAGCHHSTQWTWVWSSLVTVFLPRSKRLLISWLQSPSAVNSRSWWWTQKPGVLQSMGSQSQTWIDGLTELN